MKASIWLRTGLGVGAGMLLTACDRVPDYYSYFLAPFPAQGADLPSFSARHQGVYIAGDSTTALGIGPRDVWRQELRKCMFSRHQLDSLHHRLTADSTYQAGNGQLHYLRLVGRDSVRDTWLERDTLFTLRGANAGHLRRFQGRYYLSSANANSSRWWVERLEISGHHLMRQTLGQDTLRLAVLDTATVRYHRENGTSYFGLRPTPGRQTRHVGKYAGLWETAEVCERRN